MPKQAVTNIVDFANRRAESQEQVLDRLFREHGGALRGFLRARLGVGEDLEDVVQEVFIRLARLDDLASRLPINGSSNRSFIYTVANNLVVDMERRKAHQRRYAETQKSQKQDEDSHCLATPESIALAHDELEQLKRVILGLKPTWRDAFILTRIQSLSYKEAAQRMNVTVKQVERFLKSALIQVRKASIGVSDGEGK
ncbi:RNA polymerase sigma factor [Porticoccus sp. W117]|uniref:RNA polymerase sigma factor n=1 Tax=Porticoccus sp. W117 TaxID=3054777 RepID=UPI00259A25EA|nr:RNA polymerase sigma factor [Porticoccus sp. W117]MDM3869750.1 RNA polymerase sigma factor [Porticoccus sp. W117]